VVAALANALGPWYTLLGFIATLIALFIYFRKGLRSIAGKAEVAVEQATHAANQSAKAATQATHAATQSADAASASTVAVDNSRQATEAIEYLASELKKSNDKGEYLAEQVSTLFGALARERARNGDTAQPDRLPDIDPSSLDTELLTVTGRHRLHPSSIELDTE
jgi:hypothetical protein